jgi:hypothetical protein
VRLGMSRFDWAGLENAPNHGCYWVSESGSSRFPDRDGSLVIFIVTVYYLKILYYIVLYYIISYHIILYYIIFYYNIV